MQLAAAELDPSLDPFAVAGSFYLRQLMGRMRTMANPQQLFYGGQKVRMRASRLLEGLERAIGVRGGSGLQVDLRGVQDLTGAVGRAGPALMSGRRILRAAQRALLGAMMTVAAAVAERRIRRALRRAPAPVPPAGITSE